MKLSKKLFLSLLSLTSIVLLATLLLARWSFEQGFLKFLDAQEQERLARLAGNVTQQYAQAGESWGNLAETSLLQYIGGPSKQAENSAPRSGPGARSERPRPPPGARPPGPNSPRRPPPGARIPTDRPPPEVMRGPGSPISTVLVDQEGQTLAQLNYTQVEDGTHIHTHDIVYRGEVIGQLQSWNNSKFGSDIAEEFSQQQLVTGLIIGLFSLLFTVILALYWSKSLLKPISKIVQGLNNLTSGIYGKQLSHSRKDELGQVLNDLNKLAKVLENTRAAKNRWFADISHELRTPLTIIIGELEALKAGVRKLDPSQLVSLEDEALVLKRLIDDLYQLSVSDIGALRYQFEALDISSMCEKIARQLEQSGANKNIEVQANIQHKILINGDKERINQLLTNLSSNSMSYTNPQGKIICQLIQSDNTVIFTIEDSAPGASDQECRQLFDPLFRMDAARTKNASGAGLGLAISQKIVEAHHGKIEAKSSVLGGIKVSISLPIYHSQHTKHVGN
ncbi:ATP-binding protein [Glaciecola petra]|uniref:histidine kinase n=1 Tax=Glaciecola petra TaxID=3075602 RepID=A0ABU2ZU94_9ALTE|nr:ATP-binding protein [Aestuariibacter sp. P117]MDT0594997.1 ATP-binding protein [Aestuariibacter sp. P117]